MAKYNDDSYITNSKKIIERKVNMGLPEIKKNDIINRTIYQTYKNIELVPKEYIKNIKKMNPGWKYEFYDDNRKQEIF